MTTRVTLEWIGDQLFEACDEEGNQVLVAGKGAELEAMALRPMHMVLAALAGCAAIGVTRILEKQRQPLTDLRFEIEGDREPEPPTSFTAIRVRVIATGRGLDRARVEQAVHLTEEKYCSVYALLRRAVPIHTTVLVEEAEER